MAVVVRNQNQSPDLVYEPGFEMHYGLTEESCGVMTVTLYRTIFPQMTNWLPEDEGAQLRFQFEEELARLEAA